MHCRKGVSRSAAVVLHYLMVSYALEMQAALAWMRAARPVVNPNDSFLGQLRADDIRQRNENKRKSFLRARMEPGKQDLRGLRWSTHRC